MSVQPVGVSVGLDIGHLGLAPFGELPVPIDMAPNKGADSWTQTVGSMFCMSPKLDRVLIVVSPAKSLDYESPLATTTFTEPRLLDDAAQLVEIMSDKTPDDLRNLMSISPALAELNFERFQEWQVPFTPSTSRQSVLAFAGDVYTGLDAPASFSARDFTHAQKTFRILSGLYGLLRPLDLMMAYRLEMGTKLANDRGRDLYDYWREPVTDLLQTDLAASPGPDVLINLASNEYFNAVDVQRLGARVISPVFLDSKNGADPKIVSFFAKRARGEMSRFLIQERVSTIKGIADFTGMGYRFDDQRSTPDKPTFVRAS